MKFTVTGSAIALQESAPLVSGSVNLVKASFVFDEAWEGYSKTAVFCAVSATTEIAREVALDDAGTCVVPWEVLLPDSRLTVGVYGVRGNQRRPTLYCAPLYVARGAAPAQPVQGGGASQEDIDRTVAAHNEATDAHASRFDAMQPKLGGQPVTVVALDQIKVGDVVYTVQRSAATHVGDIYADADGTALSSSANHAVFSPDGSLLVLGGYFTGGAKLYTVSGATITYVSDLTSELPGNVTAVTTVDLSPDGALLVIGAIVRYSRHCVYLLSLSNTGATYIGEVYADAAGTLFYKDIHSAAFSPDGSLLVLGGRFAGYAKLYSVAGTTVTYVSDIYADESATALDGTCNYATFSPDGGLLILGGSFTGQNKLYSVVGTTVTYVEDIYISESGEYVNAVTFSPDGALLVAVGSFHRRSKLFSVDGATITYVDNIYADRDNTPLDAAAYTATFSPDGSLLVLGGEFVGCAKLYSVVGTTVTYVSDIYADAQTKAFDYSVGAIAFPPDGSLFVLGVDVDSGDHGAKIYTINAQDEPTRFARTALFDGVKNPMQLCVATTPIDKNEAGTVTAIADVTWITKAIRDTTKKKEIM